VQAVILAGGEGTRPKQFAPVAGKKTLLEQTLDRVALLVSPEETQIVLTRSHEPFFRGIAAVGPPSSLVIQPEDRGTAVAVLYALLRIAQRAPGTPILVVPSDHWVSNDFRFMLHVATALRVAQANPELIVLLGIAPTRLPEAQHGWIEPGDPIDGLWTGVRRVRTFIEKPTQQLAAILHGNGFLWNSYFAVGQMSTFMRLIADARPEALDAVLSVRTALGSPREQVVVQDLYRSLPAVDLSKDVLATQPRALAVISVTDVLWDDAGDPRPSH
jgi:mannose-1-phosphate guanylyltransferase